MGDATATERLTIDQFNERMPDDGVVRELVDGVVYVKGSATRRHNHVIKYVAQLLGLYEREHGGELFAPGTGTILSRFDGVIPDAAYVRPQRLHIVGEVDVEGAPDLVIEVLSPGNRAYDLIRKRDRYERAGVEEIWFVDLDAERIEVVRLGPEGRYGTSRMLGRGEQLTSPVLPGWSAPVDAILGPPGAPEQPGDPRG